MLSTRLAVVIGCAWLAAGCATTTRDTQREVREDATTVVQTTQPLVVETPVGPLTVSPAAISVQTTRRQRAYETSESSVTAQPPPVIQQAVGTMFPGLGTSLLGLLSIIFGFSAYRYRRQRNQVLDSVEAARDVLPDDVDRRFCERLAAKQDADVQHLVKTRFP